MKSLKDVYENALFGIAIFVGGMIAVVLLMKYLNQPASTQASSPPASIIPMQFPSKELNKINDSINLMVPKGTFENRTIYVDNTITMIDKKEEGGLQYSTIDFVNDGPGGVFIGINKWDSPEAPLPGGQSLSVDMRRQGAIDKLYLKAETGTTATLRLYIIK